MVNYLERQNIYRGELIPEVPRKGIRRRYTFRDLVILRAISDLLRKGVSVKKLKVAIDKLSTENGLKFIPNGIEYNSEIIRYFITDGVDIYFRGSKGNPLSITSDGQISFAFVIDFSDIHASLKRDAGKYFPEVSPKKTAARR
ncbi:MerR family transcriptional regulator [Sphingosinicella microcystinivorans]